MFHHKLLELESELVAKEQSKKTFESLPPDCQMLLSHLEKQVEVRLADKVPKDWRGWLSYRRDKQALVILRGREFKDGIFGAHKAGFDHPLGLDSITEYQRGFDVSPPQDLDHLLINFGYDEATGKFRVFLWYGENISPYKLVAADDVDEDPYQPLSEAVVEACIWIMRRPKHMTLEKYLKTAQAES